MTVCLKDSWIAGEARVKLVRILHEDLLTNSWKFRLALLATDGRVYVVHCIQFSK